MLPWLWALGLSAALAAAPAARVTVTLDPAPQELSPQAKYFLARLIGPSAAERTAGGRRVFESLSWPPGSTPESRASLIAALRAACGCEVLAVQFNAPASRTLGRSERLRDTALQTPVYDGARAAVPAAAAVPALPARAAPDAALRRLVVSVAREPDIASAGVTPRMLLALARAASGLKADFRYGDVYGVMAVSLPTAQSLGYAEKDLLNPRLNLEIGATLFAALLRQFEGDVPRALAAYQIGPRTVLAGSGIPQDKNVRALLAAYDRAFREGVAPADETALASPRPILDAARRRRLYEGIAAQVAAAEKVDPELIIAMMHAEDGAADPGAVSKRKAQGLLQLMPKTAARVGVRDRSDPWQNLHGGSRYVRELLDRFKGDAVLAVAAYNCGPGCIERSRLKIPPNGETPDYVRKVFRDYNSRTGSRIDVEPYMAGR